MTLKKSYIDRRVITKRDKLLIPWILFGGLLFLLVLVIFPAIDNITTPIEQSRINNVIKNPTTFTDRSITLEGEITNLLGTRAFTLNDPNTIDGSNLLILSAQPLQPIGGGSDDLLYKISDRVKISGPVKIFHIKDAERDLGIVLDPTKFAAWEGKPYIEAQNITKN